MRWEDERYVRLYTRDTIDWLALSFEAQGLLTLLLRKADRAGIIQLGRHGKRGVAAAVGHAHRWDDLASALEELLADGVVVLRGNALVCRNFVEAQEAQQSDGARKRAQRERDRDKFLAEGNPDATSSDAIRKVAELERASQNVTEQPELSRRVVTQDGHAGDVTEGGHAGMVTPSLASLTSLAEPLKTGAGAPRAKKQRAPKADKPPAAPVAPVEAPSSPFRVLQAELVQDFEDYLGGKYAWNGAKDSEALKRLMGLAKPQDILARWRAGLRASGWSQVSTVAQLWGKWNDLGRVAPAEPEPPKEPEQPATEAGRVWAEALRKMREDAPYAAQQLAPWRPVALEAGTLVLEAPDEYAINWAELHWHDLIPSFVGGPVKLVTPAAPAMEAAP